MALPTRLAEWSGVGTTYYVDQSIGSDSNSEAQAQSESTPWATIQKAVDSYVIPGTGDVRILVKDGTYTRTLGTATVGSTVTFASLGARTPSSSHILHLMAYEGAAPEIGQATYGAQENRCVWFDDSSATYIRIRGFEMLGDGTAYGTANATAVALDSGVNYVEIDACEIHTLEAVGGVNRATGIYLPSNSDIHIYNTSIHDIYTSGDTGADEHAISMGNVSNIVIVNCSIYDQSNGHGILAYTGGAGGSNNVVAHCVVAANSKSGVTVDGAYTSFQVRNCIIRNNTEYAVAARATSTVYAQNCLTYSNGFTGNLGNGYNQAGSSTLTLADNVTGDPLHVNYAGRDFHLTDSSPAIEIGDYNWTPTYDYDGEARSLSLPDAGPDEYVSGQILQPDADTAAGGWAAVGAASLWAATSDASDATYMLGTAS